MAQAVTIPEGIMVMGDQSGEVRVLVEPTAVVAIYLSPVEMVVEFGGLFYAIKADQWPKLEEAGVWEPLWDGLQATAIAMARTYVSTFGPDPSAQTFIEARTSQRGIGAGFWHVLLEDAEEEYCVDVWQGRTVRYPEWHAVMRYRVPRDVKKRAYIETPGAQTA